MWFKSLLTVVTAPDLADEVIAAAARITLANDGHLDVLALGLDQSQPGYAYFGTAAVVTDWTLERATTDAKAAATAARAALDKADSALRSTLSSAVAQMGGLTSIVGGRASFADLVVAPRPYGQGQGFEAQAVIEAALFEGHAPVLILPPGADATHLAAPRRIVLAWNDSAEALNAAKRALPLLRAAGHVDVTLVDPPNRGGHTDPAALLTQFLTRHGVTAEVTVLPKTVPKVSEVLTRHATDTGADLLLMGAYGHSRLREAVLGGATRAALEGATIPVLMAH